MLLAPSVVIMNVTVTQNVQHFVSILAAFHPLKPYLRPNPELFSCGSTIIQKKQLYIGHKH